MKNKSIIFRVLVDTTTFFSSLFLSSLIYIWFNADDLNSYENISASSLLFGYVVYLLFIYSSGGYRRRGDMALLSDLVTIAQGSVKTIIIYLIILFIFKIDISRILFTSFIVLLPLASVVGRILANEIFGRYFLKDFCENTIIYGAGKKGVSFVESYRKSGQNYLSIIGFIDDNNIENTGELSILGTYKDLESIVQQHKIERIIVAKNDTTSANLQALKEKAEFLDLNLSFVPRKNLYANNPIKLKDFAGITFSMQSINDDKFTFYRLTKRFMDITISIALLLMSSPMWLIIWILVKYTDRGSVFFIQERVGKDFKLFKMYKFRTMHMDSKKYEHCPANSMDPRITKVGRWLRRTSLDELPQLLNVLLGHMSMVGPRPEMPFIVQEYNEIEKRRLRVLPGITGLWQISRGRKAEITENIEYDLYYIENRGITLDIILLLSTVVFVFRGIAH